MNCPKFLDTTKARIEEEHQTQRGQDTIEPRWNPDRGGMQRLGASSKQIQTVKVTTVKACRQCNATKETLADAEDPTTRWQQCGVDDTGSVRLRRLSSTAILRESELRV
ncbi:hypothetical protein HN51_070506 [Arachis hypogaea]